MDVIGTAIHRALIDQRLTQGQLAERAGVSRQLINRLVTGHPTAEIGKVVDVLTALGLQLTVTSRTPAAADTPTEAPKTFATESDYLHDLLGGRHV